MVVAHQGFEWRAERPQEATFVGQKWGWTGTQPGDWAELQFDSRDGASPADATAGPAAGAAGAAGASGADAATEEAGDDEEEADAAEGSEDEQDAAAGDEQAEDEVDGQDSSSGGGSSSSSRAGGNSTAAATKPAPKAQKQKRLPNAEVLLSHLRSYEGMGVAQVRRMGGPGLQLVSSSTAPARLQQDGVLSCANLRPRVTCRTVTLQVRCVSGCTCPTSYLDGTWDQQATLQYIHRFKVRRS